MDDWQIIELFSARNERAITETDLKYGKLCLRVAGNILNNVQDAEECVNDAYLSVWNQIPPTQPDHFSAFLCKIVRNLALKKLAYTNALKRSPEAVVSFAELEQILPDERIAPNTDEAELGSLISSFLRSEQEVSRNVFLRRYWFFDSISDIAARYGFRESKVKSILFRTRNRLKIYLTKEGVSI